MLTLGAQYKGTRFGNMYGKEGALASKQEAVLDPNGQLSM